MKVLFNFFILVFFTIAVYESKAQMVTGITRDSVSGELLIGTSIYNLNTKAGTLSNKDGYFSIKGKSGDSIALSFVGYKKLIHILTDSDFKAYYLQPDVLLDEVTILAQKDPVQGEFILGKDFIYQLPAIGAKPDILKAAQILPGIQSTHEGSSQLIVRGGDPGHNLLLIDDIPLIYVHHLGGLFSTFNPDMINELSILKGNFPSRYGGRLSSVVNIVQKEGSISDHSANYHIAFTDFSFVVEGPLKLNNSSFIVSGRKTLTDPLLYLGTSLLAESYTALYGFHDINAKISWRPNRHDHVYLNFYQGDDYLQYIPMPIPEMDLDYSGKFTTIWGNWLGALQWKRFFNSGLYMHHNISATRYRASRGNISIDHAADSILSANKTMTILENVSARSFFSYQPMTNLTIDFGNQFVLINNKPVSTSIRSPFFNGTDALRTLENSIFSNLSYKTTQLDLDVGGRWSVYNNPEIMETRFEPRVSAAIKLTDQLILSGNYMEVNQFNTLILNNSQIFQSEIWLSANEQIPIQSNRQFSIEMSYSLYANTYDFKVGAYRKSMNGLTTFRDGASTTLGVNILESALVTNGEGDANGIEFIASKNTGKLTGTIAYDFSIVNRRYDEINNGQAFPFSFNRPHELNIQTNYVLTKRWAVGMLWTLQSGLPFTPLENRQFGLNPVVFAPAPFEIINYGERNSARMKPFHRLDLAVTWKGVNKKDVRVHWTFSVYNVYARKNPFYYFYNNYGGGSFPIPGQDLPFMLYQASYFGLIPTVSYQRFLDINQRNKSSLWQRIKNYMTYE